MLRIQSNTIQSENEINAERALATQKTAESEFIILSENKKKLEKDISELKGYILANQDILNKLKQEIVTTKNGLIATAKEFNSKKDELNNLSLGMVDAKKGLESFRNECDLSKQKLQSEVDEFIAIKNKEKAEKTAEIEKLASTKKEITKQIEISEKDLNNLAIQNRNSLAEKDLIQKDIKALLSQENDLKCSIENLKSGIQTMSSDYTRYEEEINTVVKTLSEKTDELAELITKIEKKTKEYKEIESKSFVITQKQDLLNQKEAFIKSRYERAGIKYED